MSAGTLLTPQWLIVAVKKGNGEPSAGHAIDHMFLLIFATAVTSIAADVFFRMLGRLRVWFYQALEPLAPARLLYRQGGDLLSHITSDIALLESFYVRSAAPLLSNCRKLSTSSSSWRTGQARVA